MYIPSVYSSDQKSLDHLTRLIPYTKAALDLNTSIQVQDSHFNQVKALQTD